MYSTIMYASRASRGATAARRSSTKGRAMLRHLEDTVLSLVLLAAVSFLPNYTTAFLFPPTTTGHLLGCCQPLASATQSSLSTGCPATFMRPAHSSSGSSTQQQQLGISNSRSNRSRACYSRAHARSKRRGHTSLRMASEGMGESMVDAEADAESEYVRWPSSNRIAIGIMASAGALESAFLTYQKMKPGGLDLLCGVSGGCADVLSGPYSNVLGVPLTIPGTLGYAAVAALAGIPLLIKNTDDLDKWTRSLILMATTAMGVFSVYLSSLLVFKIGHPCPWCITSALLSASMCGVAWMKKAVPEKTKAAVMGVCTTLITAFACLTIFVITEATLDLRQAEASPGELVGLQLVAAPTADTESTAQAMRVGKKLKSLDAKMYGAYWCTHCFHQKQMLGKQAMAKVKYIECSNRGENNQVGLCKAADIPGFPTWDIDGKLYPGEQTLEDLEEILGLEPFKG